MNSLREYYQTHVCEGYRAKVTIEWSMPDTVDADLLPAWRKEVAEEIADSILAFSGKKIRDMVQAMRGYTPQIINDDLPTAADVRGILGVQTTPTKQD